MGTHVALPKRQTALSTQTDFSYNGRVPPSRSPVLGVPMWSSDIPLGEGPGDINSYFLDKINVLILASDISWVKTCHLVKNIWIRHSASKGKTFRKAILGCACFHGSETPIQCKKVRPPLLQPPNSGGPQLAADYCLITWNHPGNRAGGTFAIMCNALVSYTQNWSPMSNIFCNCHASHRRGGGRSRKISSFINLTYDFGELLEAVLLDSFWTLLAKLIAAHKINFLHWCNVSFGGSTFFSVDFCQYEILLIHFY